MACPILPPVVEELEPARLLSPARPNIMAYAADPERYALSMADPITLMRACIRAETGDELALDPLMPCPLTVS